MNQEECNEIKLETQRLIKLGWDNTRVEWKRMALNVIYDLCIKKETFTANEFTKIIKSSPIKTHDNRSIGGAIMTAKKFKWVENTGMSEKSRAAHLSPISIWRSLIFKDQKNINNQIKLL